MARIGGVGNELTDLILAERSARAALDGGASKLDRMTNARAYWRSAEALFRYLAENNVPLSTKDVADTFAFISLQVGYLAAGVVPEPASDVAIKGNVSPGPSERRDKSIAAAYRRACEPEALEWGGVTFRVADKRPMQTLADWFGVVEGTLRKWFREYPPSLPAAFAGTTGEDLAALTERAGQSYIDQRSKDNDRRSRQRRAVRR